MVKTLFGFGCLGMLTFLCCAPSLARQTEAKPSALQTRRDVFAEDARLVQKVAVHAEGVPLDELLARLSQQSGVTLKVQQDIADEKVIVFAPAKPLRSLLYDLAGLLNDTWMRQEQPTGKPTYRLVRNGRAREYEADLLEKMNSRLKIRLEEQVRALAETPEERKRRPQNDPIRERLSDPHAHMGTRFYALLNAAQRQSLFAQDYFDVPYTVLNPDQQAALRGAFMELNADTALLDDKGAPATGVPENIERSALRFDLHEQGGKQSLGFGFDPPGYGLDGVTVASIDNRAEWLLPPHGNPYTGAPVSAKSALPAADTIRFAQSETGSQGKTWMDRLASLAERASITVCADYYRCKAAHPVKALDPDALPSAPSPAGSSIVEMDELCRPAGYLWWMQGKTLLLRKRDWFKQRVYEPPDHWTLEIAKRLQTQKGVPTYGDAMRLLDLTTEQIAGLMSFNDASNGEWYGDLGVMKRAVLGSRELLAIWNAFPNSNPGVLPGREKFKDVETFSRQFQQSTRSYGEFTEQQRNLAVSFVSGDYVFGMRVARRKRPVTEAEMTTFHTRIASPAPQEDEAKRLPSFPSVPIELAWWIQEGNGANLCRLFLPLALPQDRRDKTKIEIVP